MTAPARAHLRAIPSVDRVLRELGELDLPRRTVVELVRRELEAARAAAIEQRPGTEAVIERIRMRVADHRRGRLRPVINGTGVIIHTNLGRSPLAPEAVTAIADVAASYSNLEYELPAGQRGSRAAYVESQLATLCGAEAATVVNNCAAALVLVLSRFVTPQRPKVVISRGELVQIGGGFRIPDILEATGARLCEVGTTNRTTLEDYAQAVDDGTALVLKVHQSNFYMDGFVAAPATADLATLARERGVLLVEDLGSGAVSPIGTIPGAENEPAPIDVLRQGVDLVTFSGDKLLGGPQAGVIAGAGKHVAQLKAYPLFRALRCDKLVLAGLQATLDLHLDGQAERIPILSMMRCPLEHLRARAQRLAERLAHLPLKIGVGPGLTRIGGGSLPRVQVQSVVLECLPEHESVDDLASRLRAGPTPVVGYIDNGRFKIDLRTVFPRQDDLLATCFEHAVTAKGPAA